MELRILPNDSTSRPFGERVGKRKPHFWSALVQLRWAADVTGNDASKSATWSVELGACLELGTWNVELFLPMELRCLNLSASRP